MPVVAHRFRQAHTRPTRLQVEIRIQAGMGVTLIGSYFSTDIGRRGHHHQAGADRGAIASALRAPSFQ